MQLSDPTSQFLLHNNILLTYSTKIESINNIVNWIAVTKKNNLYYNI